MTSLKNGLNLAYWLYKVHPEIYQQLIPLAKRAQGMGSLGDDLVTSTDIGTGTLFDSVDTFDSSATIGAISPDLAIVPTPDLASVSVDWSADQTVPTFQTESDPSTSIFSALGSGLQSVGNWLTTTTGLATVGAIATKVFGNNTPQQSTVATQVQRTAAGSNAVPITYGRNAQGQVVPILTTGYNAGVPLSFASLQKLLPSSLQRYAVPIGIGIAGLVVWQLFGRRGRG